MIMFGIPLQIVNSLITLFFSTQIEININRHRTAIPITQQRGLRQGDPLSPLLSNIAFEPFLRFIEEDPKFKRFDFSVDAPAHQPTDALDDLAESFSRIYQVDPVEPTPHTTPVLSPIQP